MRLTLRTLLAYLDDVLEPAQVREIGRKIRESPVAAALVSRIRESVRRRRLGAPDLEGPGVGLDPNLVAAYLDNTLPPNRVVETEQICLESDVQLAEVAACHQILTLVVTEARDVPRTSLDRYYALGPVPADEQLQVAGVAGESVRTNGAAPVGPPVLHAAPAPQSVEKPWSQQVLPLVGIAILLLVAFVLLAPDRNLFRGLARTDGARPASPPEGVVDAPTSPPALDATEAPAATGDRAATPAPTTPAIDAASAATTLPRGLDPAPPPDAPEVATTTPPADASAAVAAAVPTESATTSAVPSATPPPPAPAIEPAPALVRVPIHYNSVEGVLLRYEPGDGHWYVHPRRGEVHADEIFACPEPFEALFDFDQGVFKVTLLGDSSIHILPGTEQQRQGLTLRRGRIILQPGAAKSERRDFVVQTGESRWWLSFADADSQCGIEVQLREPAGFEHPWDGHGYHAAVYVAAGTVQIQGESGDPVALSAGQRRVLSNTPTPAAVSGSLPAWLDPQRRQAGETLRTFAARFEKEFDPTLAVDLTIPALTKDPHFRLAQLAARCLGVMENYRALAQALAQSEHEEARTAAAQGLRLWLGQAADRGPLLKRELANLYPADEAAVVYRLLWNFTPDDARDKIASQQLVDWLTSTRVEIRELAFLQLVELTGRKYDYRPLGTPSQRASAAQRWQAHLQREGALLKTEE
jgi:hypothetical protein